MCRLIAYAGVERSLESLLIEPEFGLYRQSWEPQRQTLGSVNADGFGVGWYQRSTRAEPAVFRSPKPIWAEPSFASMAGLIRSNFVVAAVRGATPPAVVEVINVPPFRSGRYLFAHNGAIEGFRDGMASRLRRSLSEPRDAAIEGSTDSEVVFALVLDRIDRGMSLAEAMGDAIAFVLAATSAGLNLILSDGAQIVASSVGNSLCTLVDQSSVVVASEPYDDSPGWTSVPDMSLVVTSGSTIDVSSLDLEPRAALG